MENNWALLIGLERGSLPHHPEASQANGQLGTLQRTCFECPYPMTHGHHFMNETQWNQYCFQKPASRAFQPKTCNPTASERN